LTTTAAEEAGDSPSASTSLECVESLSSEDEEEEDEEEDECHDGIRKTEVSVGG
jgi:hypothetical protein